MKKMIIVLLAAVAFFFCGCGEQTRKEVEKPAPPEAYQQTAEEAMAIQLAKNAETLFWRLDHRLMTKAPRAEYLTNDSQIRAELNKIKGDFRVIGWETKKVADDTYLVTYTYERRGATRGWPFEVKVSARIVRYVIGDPELEKKYGWGSGGQIKHP